MTQVVPIDLIARALALKSPRGVKVIDTGFESTGASLAGYLFFLQHTGIKTLFVGLGRGP